MKKRGVSPIVIVITIIVMITLIASIILSINNSSIIERLNKSKRDSDREKMLEAARIELREYKEKIGDGLRNRTAEDYIKERLTNQFTEKQLEELSILNDGTIQILPVIPDGFVMSIYDGEQKVTDGLVIYEATEEQLKSAADQKTAMETYNQYVWIPVTDINSFTLQDWNSQTNVSSGTVNEPFSKGIINKRNDLTGEYKEYKRMRKSVEKYEGFYIARYEAGSKERRTYIANGGDGTTLVPSKKGQYPYNYVGWGPSMISVDGDVTDKNTGYNQGKGAVALSRSAYSKNKNFSVVSTLIYGVQWDAAISFMQDVNNITLTPIAPYVQNSTNMGWYSNNYESGNKNHITGIDLNGGKNKVKNIYDMAGNLYEYTMETNEDSFRSIRGGNYDTNGTTSAAHRSFSEVDEAYAYCGFRIALYIK